MNDETCNYEGCKYDWDDLIEVVDPATGNKLWFCEDHYNEWIDEQDMVLVEDDGLSDVEADAMTLAMAGWGTDEDYFHADSHLEMEYEDRVSGGGEE